MELRWSTRDISNKALADIRGMDVSANWLLNEANPPAADTEIEESNPDFSKFLTFPVSASEDDVTEAPIPFLITLKDVNALDSLKAVMGDESTLQNSNDRLNAGRVFLLSEDLKLLQLPGEEEDEEVKAPFLGKPLVAFAWRQFFKNLNSQNDDQGHFEAFRQSDKIITISTPIRAESWLEGDKVPKFSEPPQPSQDMLNGFGEESKKRNQPKKLIIMAVIDDGIAIANRCFQKPDGTSRVLNFWHMGLKPLSFEEAQTVPWGREYWKASATPQDRQSIDYILSETKGDEARFYRLAGISDHTRQANETSQLRFSHGTHVLDLAAGSDPKDPNDVTHKRPIIAVQLPADVVEDSSGATLGAHLCAAIQFIRARARRIAKGSGLDVAVVVNLSYGFTAGPHDGSTQIEKFLDNAIHSESGTDDPPLQIVLSAGNANLSRCYAQMHPRPEPEPETNGEGEQEFLLRWRILPDDETQTEMQIWLPGQPPEELRQGVPLNLLEKTRVKLHIRTPDGEENSQPAIEDPRIEHILKLKNKVIARVRYIVDPGNGRGMFSIRTMPTVRRLHDQDHADLKVPAGQWQLRIKIMTDNARDTITREDPIRAWIQRDDSIYGFRRRGRQSFFEDPEYPNEDLGTGYTLTEVDPESPVQRESLLSAIASGARTVVAGGYEKRGFRALPISAGGPIVQTTKDRTTPQQQDMELTKPDLLAPASDSFVHRGILAAGSRSSSRVAMLGTSAAAPQVARRLANLYSYSGSKNWNRVSFARQIALGDEFEISDGHSNAPSLPEERGGKGRMLVADTKDPGVRNVKPGLQKKRSS